ncbi:MAG: hypothetical protein Q9163_004482 [Psora crenata]
MGVRFLQSLRRGDLQQLAFPKIIHRSRFYTSQKTQEPLRILFCGSDEFSIASLRALYNEHVRDSRLIASIDVVCRPGKPTGRGLKTIRTVPIAGVAHELGLRLHQIDTFAKWQPPEPKDQPINLIVAVSFGLLVPPRILEGARYGGLNVHPSMLPEFRGPAPLHHTLLTGHFDEGLILAQTRPPGFEHHCTTVPELLNLTATEGANMLIRCIKDGAFKPPLQVRGDSVGIMSRASRYAPKITPADRHIDWNSWTADEILCRHRVIGPLWNNVTTKSANYASSVKTNRLIWSSGFTKSSGAFNPGIGPGQLFIRSPGTIEQAVLIATCDNQCLKVSRIKLEGGKEDEPVRSCKNAGILSGNPPPKDRDASQPEISCALLTHALT